VQVENFANEMVKKEIERLRQDSSDSNLLELEKEFSRQFNKARHQQFMDSMPPELRKAAKRLGFDRSDP